MKSSRGYLYGAFTFLIFLVPGLIITGCDLFSVSMADYFLDNTGVVEVTGVGGRPKIAFMANGTILIPPARDEPVTILEVALANPRNLAVRQELLGAPPGKHITLRQAESTKTELRIEGAALDEAYDLSLVMQSPDGLRDFPGWDIRVRCVSFNTALSDFRVNETHPYLAAGPYAFLVELPAETTDLIMEGAALEPKAALTLFQGRDAAGPAIASGTGRVLTAPPVVPKPGDNYFYLEVRTPGAVQGYPINVIRTLDINKRITEFYFTVGAKKYGAGPGVEAGSGSISGTNITAALPYGTDVSAMTATASHTGASISPDPGTPQNYANPVTYTVRAADGSTVDYTVTVNVAPNTLRAITAFNITGPVNAAGVIDEAAKTITINVPYGTDLSAMTAGASYTGVSISPDPETPQNYTGPVTYTVRAADGSTADYTATVNAAKIASITAINGDFTSPYGFIQTDGLVSGTDIMNAITSVAGTDSMGTAITLKTADYLVDNITGAAAGANTNATLRVSADRTSTGADITEGFTVYVKNDAREITDFSITGPVNAAGLVDETAKTITVTVPYGTDLSAITATASHTGVSISPDPETPQNYTGPVTYTVRAADGSQAVYTVTVNPRPGITISGIIVKGLDVLTLSWPPELSPDGTIPLVDRSAPITITISGGTVTKWRIEVSGSVFSASYAANNFIAPGTPGFYNVNVIATVGGVDYVDYSASFGLVVK